MKTGKHAIVYGISVNYKTKTADIFQLSLDFKNSCSCLKKLNQEVPICQAFNYFVGILKV